MTRHPSAFKNYPLVMRDFGIAGAVRRSHTLVWGMRLD
jgi:hypothetical protein